MLAMLSNSSTASIGKAVFSRFGKTVLPTPVASLAVAALAVVASVEASAAVVVLAAVAASAVMAAAVATVVAVVAALMPVPVSPILAGLLRLLTPSLTTLRLDLNAAKPFSFAM